MRVEIVFALPERQFLEELDVPEGSRVVDVIEASSLAKAFPEIDVADLTTGIWGKVATRDQQVRDGQRVELYRTLAMDPREARRVKAGL